MKKKIMAVALSALMAFSVMPMSAFATFAEGTTPTEIKATYDWYSTPTEDVDTYEIDSIGDLAGLANITMDNVVVGETTIAKHDFEGDVVKLAADLAFADSEYWFYKTSSTEINYVIGTFKGTFDGQGHAISGLKMVNNTSTKSMMALFNTMSGTLKDLTVSNVDICVSSKDNQGVICVTNAGTIENCHAKTVTINDGGQGALAAVGFCYKLNNGASINGCSVTDLTIDVDSATRAAGFIGTIFSNATVTDSHVKTAKMYLGKDDTSKLIAIGGFVGEIEGTKTSSITNCTVTGLEMVLKGTLTDGFSPLTPGGFIGSISYSANIETCSVTGAIDATETTDDFVVGGFVGDYGSASQKYSIAMKNCTANVDIQANGFAGGFVGKASISTTMTPTYTSSYKGSATYENCTATGDVTSLSATAGGFVAIGDRGTYENCTATGDVVGKVAGGFWGEITPNTAGLSLTIDTCEASGTVTGETVASGFIGQMTTSNENNKNTTVVTISNSTATYDINSKNGEIISFVKETVSSGSDSHYVTSGNAVRFDKTISIMANSETAVGEDISVSINIESGGSFNACELELTYDAAKLTFNKEASTLNGATVTAENGVLKLVDYGASQKFDNGIYTLVFTAIKGGDADIALTSAGFGTSASAETDNLAKANCDGVAVTVNVKHGITLDSNFTGNSSIANGENYMFSFETVTGAYYDYDTPTVTMDGEAATVIDNGDGTWTVENVTGNLVISGTRTPKTYGVTIDGNAEESATYGVDYTFTLPEDIAPGLDEGTRYSVGSVTVDGNPVNYTTEGTNVTISGTNITGAVEIEITETPLPATKVTVTVAGDGAGAAEGYATVADKGEDYTLTLRPEKGYVYTVKAEGLDVQQSDNAYTVKAGEENVVFTVTRAVDVTSAKATEYVTLNGGTMWLVQIGEKSKVDGKVYTYDGQAMFWSEKYNAYVTLVVGTATAPAITADKFNIITGTAIVVTSNKDVNMSGSVDANDAQLVWNMYNSQYSDFTTNVTIEKFLRADVNVDGTITVADATAIVSSILK